MITGLWPALLAVLLGGGGDGQQQQQHDGSRSGAGGDGFEGMGMRWMMVPSSSSAAALRERVVDMHEALLNGDSALVLWLFVVSFLLLAYLTNPSETKLRTHLTDLSFHLHLRRLRGGVLDGSDGLASAGPASGSFPGEYRQDVPQHPHARRHVQTTTIPLPPPTSKKKPPPRTPEAAPGSTGSNASTAGQTQHIHANGASGKATGGKGERTAAQHSAGSSAANTAGSSTLAKGKGKQKGEHVAAAAAPDSQQHGLDGKAPAPSASPAGTSASDSSRMRRLAPISFSNRVSISLRTPTYVLTSYGLFSTARILLPAPLIGRKGDRASASGRLGTTSKRGSNNAQHGSARAAGGAVEAGANPASGSAAGLLPSVKATSSSATSARTSGSSTPAIATTFPPTTAHRTGAASSASAALKGSVTVPSTSLYAAGMASMRASEQGGYFVGFLGFWWTIDDGTSATGQRERKRLATAVSDVREVVPAKARASASADREKADPKSSRAEATATEVHDPMVAAQAKDADSAAHTLAPHAGADHTPISKADVSTPAPAASPSADEQAASSSATAASTAASRQKLIKNLQNGTVNVPMRGGQRRSSPVPRGGGASLLPAASSNVAASKQGSNTASKKGPATAQPAANAAPGSASSGSGVTGAPEQAGNLLSTDADRNLPGLPFHVGQQTQAVPSRQPQQQQQAGKKDRSASPLAMSSVADSESNNVSTQPPTQQQTKASKAAKKAANAAEAVISTISHSASAPDAAVSAVTPAAALLQTQLDELRTSTAATQTRLQNELEDLRNRRKDEDANRTELKARLKILEEGKRAAEAERLEAERKLISARSSKKSVEDRVGKLRAELSKLDKRERELEERAGKGKSEREEKLRDLREKVRLREEVLSKEEETTANLQKRVHALEGEIEERKADLQTLRESAAGHASHTGVHGHGGTHGRNRAGSGRTAAAASAHPNAATPVAPPGIVPGGRPHQAPYPHLLHQQDHSHGLHHQHQLGTSASFPNLPSLFDGSSGYPSSTGGYPYSDEAFGGPSLYPHQRHAQQQQQQYLQTHYQQQRIPSPASGSTRTPPGSAVAQPGTGNNAAGQDGHLDATANSRLSHLGIGLPSSMSTGHFASPFAGFTFLDHSLQQHQQQSRSRQTSSSSTPPASGAPGLSSSMNTSAIGNTASAASALYSRQLASAAASGGYDHADEASSSSSTGFGSFAPFGPVSPVPSEASNGTATSSEDSVSRGQDLMSKRALPATLHPPYFESDREDLLRESSTRARSTSIGGTRVKSAGQDAAASYPAPISPPGKSSQAPQSQGSLHRVSSLELGSTPHARLRREHSADSRAARGTLHEQTEGAGNAEPSDSETEREKAGALGPLSPMTPHQASLIPSQLFDLLDDVDMPASPTPALTSSTSSSRANGQPVHQRGQTHAGTSIHSVFGDSKDAHSDVSAASATQASTLPHTRNFSASSGPWADLLGPSSNDFADFDRPRGYYSANVSRKTSARQPPGGRAASAASASALDALGSDSIFSLGHTQNSGSVSSLGARSTSSSAGGHGTAPGLVGSGSISPSLSAPTATSSSGASASGKVSPHDHAHSHSSSLLFDKARHALSLNPDAKAFSFNRPLPAGSSSSLSSLALGNGTASGPIGSTRGDRDARSAFERKGSGSETGSGPSSAGAVAAPSATWASPIPSNRGAPPPGFGTSGHTKVSSVGAQGPTATAVSSFSPFDDDDLLRGW